MARRLRSAAKVIVEGAKALQEEVKELRDKKPEVVILVPVESSNIHAVGYHGGNMYVKYKADLKNETVYIFADMPKADYQQILSAESVGKALYGTGRKGEKM